MDNKIKLIEALASVAEELEDKKLKEEAKEIDMFIVSCISEIENDLSMKKESQLLPLKDRGVAIGTGMGAGAAGGAAIGGKFGKGILGKIGGGLLGAGIGSALGAGAGYLATEHQGKDDYIQQIDNELLELKARISYLEQEKKKIGVDHILD